MYIVSFAFQLLIIRPSTICLLTSGFLGIRLTSYNPTFILDGQQSVFKFEISQSSYDYLLPIKIDEPH